MMIMPMMTTIMTDNIPYIIETEIAAQKNRILERTVNRRIAGQ
jgi:hypothetical protein